MPIWVDADACPKSIKEILFKAAVRTKTVIILVANQVLTVPRSPYIKTLQVAQGLDVADHYIIQQAAAEDLVITADIPLAAAVVDKGVAALSPRGELYSTANIKQRLAIRNFMTDLRDSGRHCGGPAAMSNKDNQAFANALDKYLAQAVVRARSK